MIRMINLYAATIRIVERAFHILENLIEKPKLINVGSRRLFRYRKPSIESAIILKAARVISGLNASLILIKHGYAQEAYCIFRTIDEFNEDITFLLIPFVTGRISEDHERYLEYMFQEEKVRKRDSYVIEKKRPTIPRKKIHSAISNFFANLAEKNQTYNVQKTIHATFSGYIHGAANHILDMYGGNPQRYHLNGTLGTPRVEESIECANNYFYRSLLSIKMIAWAFGQEKIQKELSSFKDYYEKTSVYEIK
jgi:hypothetical protein